MLLLSLQTQQSTRDDRRRRLAYYSAATAGGSEGAPPTVRLALLYYYGHLTTFVDIKQGRGRRGRRSGHTALPGLSRVRTVLLFVRDVCLMDVWVLVILVCRHPALTKLATPFLNVS